MTVLSYTDRTIILLLVEPIKADLDIDDVQFSLLTGLSFALFYALFGVPFGWLADRYSRRWIIFFGVAGWSIATASCGLAGSFGALFLARMMVGVGEATLSPVGYALVGDMFPRRRLALALGILAGGTAIGSAVAYAIGGALISWADAHGALWGMRPWQMALMAVGLPGLLIAPLIFLVPRSADRARIAPDVISDTPPTAYLPWLKKNLPCLLPTMLGSAMIFMLMFGITAWMPALLYRRFGLEPAQVGEMLGLAFGLSGPVGFVLSGWLVDKMAALQWRHVHLNYLAIVIALLGIIGATSFSLAQTTTQILILLGLLAFVAPINGPVIAFIQIHTPDHFRARTIALFLFFYNLLGMSAGPSAVAIIAKTMYGGELSPALATFSAGCGIIGFISYRIARHYAPDVRSIDGAGL
ncbi:MFS transporter [Sphingobium indicum]|nr:MFS transporter [Sphingobium indicum]